HYFVTSTSQIKRLLSNFDATERFSSIKSSIANILIIPGLIVSIAYISQIFGFFGHIVTIESVLTNTILNVFFGIAVIGVIMLWHDYYSSKVQGGRLPNIENIPEKEWEEIINSGFKFGRYSQLEAS